MKSYLISMFRPGRSLMGFQKLPHRNKPFSGTLLRDRFFEDGLGRKSTFSKMANKHYTHPRDKAIKFYDFLNGKEHVYTIEGATDHPTSVTTRIHDYFEKFDGDAIVDKYYDKWQRDHKSKYYGMTKQQILDSWEQNRKEASELGSKMHKVIELFFNHELKESPNTIEFTYFANFWKDFTEINPQYKPHRNEWMIYTDSKKTSGSIDSTLINDKNELIILDWKRAGKITAKCDWGRVGKGCLSHLEDCNYVHYSLQLSCYKYILETFYGYKVNRMFLVVLHPDNPNYVMIEVYPLDKEAKLLML